MKKILIYTLLAMATYACGSYASPPAPRATSGDFVVSTPQHDFTIYPTRW